MLNEILNRKNTNICDQPDKYFDGNGILMLPKDMANGFNDYFTIIGPWLSTNNDTPDK